MPIVKVSKQVKQELEDLKKEGGFKSLDAVIRHYLDSFIEVVGGIFLGSNGGVWCNIRNVRHSSLHDNFTDYYITPPKTIRLYKCLKCQTTSFQKEDEMIIVPNCMGCGKGMTPITVQVGFPDSE